MSGEKQLKVKTERKMKGWSYRKSVQLLFITYDQRIFERNWLLLSMCAFWRWIWCTVPEKIVIMSDQQLFWTTTEYFIVSKNVNFIPTKHELFEDLSKRAFELNFLYLDNVEVKMQPSKHLITPNHPKKMNW